MWGTSAVRIAGGLTRLACSLEQVRVCSAASAFQALGTPSMVESLRLRAPAPTPAARSAAPPRVSVLIPAYNVATTIGEALESALTQDPLPHEVIVSDDGS